MRNFFCTAACLLGACFGLVSMCAAENAMSVGYGFGIANQSEPGFIQDRHAYHYTTFSYLYEKPFTPAIALALEPYVNVVSEPQSGADGGLNLFLKAYLPEFSPHNRLYITVGTGGAYTSIRFPEQGTHGLFILQGGIGFRSGRFYVEDRFHHYSNGGLASPNRSVNSDLFKVGWYF